MILQVDDRILVQAAQDGDLDAFEALVRRHQPGVYRVAWRMLGSDADAQDATQQTFVRAWRALPRFRHDSVLTTWLYRIVTRRCLDLTPPAGQPRHSTTRNRTRAWTQSTPPSNARACKQSPAPSHTCPATSARP